jgi:hypothetical protein
VHGMLASLGITDRTLLWNAFPIHPHDAGAPRTNRTPTQAELDAGMASLRLAVVGRRVICVGNPAKRSMEKFLVARCPESATCPPRVGQSPFDTQPMRVPQSSNRDSRRWAPSGTFSTSGQSIWRSCETNCWRKRHKRLQADNLFGSPTGSHVGIFLECPFRR